MISCQQSVLYNAYTCRNGELVQIFEGWGRSSFQWMGDDGFFHYGSGGVSNSLFAKAHLRKDGTELIWDEVYFTEEVFPATGEKVVTDAEKRRCIGFCIRAYFPVHGRRHASDRMWRKF